MRGGVVLFNLRPLAKQTFWNWEKDKSVPGFENIRKIAGIVFIFIAVYLAGTEL